MINFGTHIRKTDRNYHGIYGGGGGIEFRAHEDEEESGITSPPLWHTSPPRSPSTETIPLQSHPYNPHHYNSLSPTSRLQAITRGREELMEMVKQMPESSYELSLKDLVEHSKVHRTGQTRDVADKDHSNIKRGNKKKKTDQAHMSRSGSLNNEPVLLKMFLPFSFGLMKKKKSTTTTTTFTKISPRPAEGEKFADKDWWRRRLSGLGETDSNGSGGSSGSRDSSRNSNTGEYLPNCWSFFNKKSKAKEKDKGTH